MANDQNWNQQENMDQQSPVSKNRGNFKNDPARAAREGKKGGEASRGRRS